MKGKNVEVNIENRQKWNLVWIYGMIIIENYALKRYRIINVSVVAVSNYLKDRFVACDASKAWGKVFSVVNICNLEN